MKKHVLLMMLFIGMDVACVLAQETRLWTESDRKYLLDNLTRSRNELVKATEGLSERQWNFKESAERWSIKEIVEHIAIWELLFEREITMALAKKPQPDLIPLAKPDSIYFGFIMEEKTHVTTHYTAPFTYSVPMGLNDGKNNMAWLLKLRNESIRYLTSATEDLRTYFLDDSRPNIHQIYITVFGHTDRHLRQIRKVKAHPDFPR